MERWAIKEFLRVDNEQERNEYINDLGNSVRMYVKTGNKNELLCNFLQHASEINSEFKRILKEQEHISKVLLETVSIQLEDDMIDKTKPKQLVKQLEECTKRVIYLSHLNMLYNLYTREMQIREEQNNYRKETEKFPKLYNIAQKINAERRITCDKLIEIFSLSDEEYCFITNKYDKYFNLHRRKDGAITQISLAPLGKNYLTYMQDMENSFSQSQVDMIVMKNFEILMQTIQIELITEIPQRVGFVGLSSESERRLEFLHNQMFLL